MSDREQPIKEQELFEYKASKEQQIGTEIFDPNLPSSLNFDEDKKKVQHEGVQVNKQAKFVEKKGNSLGTESIKSYTVKGKANFENDSKHQPGQVICELLKGFEVRAHNQTRSQGIKSIWEALVGYVTREIHIEDGYFYLCEKVKDGHLVHSVFNLSDLFKVFADCEESKVRLVFRTPQSTSLVTKNFTLKNYDELIERLGQQISQMNLAMVAQ